MRDLIKFSATGLCFLHTALIYLLVKLALSYGYDMKVTYSAAVCLFIGSWLILSLLFFQPEYFALGAWGFGLMWWTAVFAVLESPVSGLSYLLFDDLRYIILTIKVAGWILLVVLGLLYAKRERSPWPLLDR